MVKISNANFLKKKLKKMSKANKDSHLIESIAVKEFFEIYGKQLKLRLVTGQKTLSRSMIREKSINRPALAVTGYFKYFANKRIQLFGAGEMAFFREQSAARRKIIIETMVAKKIPCVVVSRSLLPPRR